MDELRLSMTMIVISTWIHSASILIHALQIYFELDLGIPVRSVFSCRKAVSRIALPLSTQ